MKLIIKKAYYIFLPIILGSIVGLIISGSIDYASLNKPPLSPPKIIFPIMWTIIYLLMGLSYYIYKKNNEHKNKIDIIYYTQLLLNLLWPILFFNLKWRLFSIFWISLLTIFVVLLITKYLNHKKTSAYLNIPYILWCLFATYLNIGIYLLN